MKEVEFIKQNRTKWSEAELTAQASNKADVNKVVEHYVQITDDLSYSKAHYPNSQVTAYLNSLADCLYNRLNKRRKNKLDGFMEFWTKEVPMAVYSARKELIFSLVIFVLSMGIGVLSANGDSEFSRLILGDGYIEMTLDNIEKGNPMGVYANEGELGMFVRITFNNVMVGIRTFVAGVIALLGTVYILLFNGIMVGTFETFLYQHGVFSHSLGVVFLHGTIELSVIVICGGAGLCLGTGWLFPGTYKRIDSFKKNAKIGLKILLSTIPLFIVAGFIEGYITRYEYMHIALKALIIGLSIFIITFYYIYLPYKIRRNDTRTKLQRSVR